MVGFPAYFAQRAAAPAGLWSPYQPMSAAITPSPFYLSSPLLSRRPSLSAVRPTSSGRCCCTSLVYTGACSSLHPPSRAVLHYDNSTDANLLDWTIFAIYV